MIWKAKSTCSGRVTHETDIYNNNKLIKQERERQMGRNVWSHIDFATCYFTNGYVHIIGFNFNYTIKLY